jgi:hypothetical protein
MINQTKQLRIEIGKFETLTVKSVGENNHASFCQACGSDKPETLHPVKSADGKILWVGVVCKAILTDERLPSLKDGEIWALTNKNNQTIDYIKPDKNFIAKAEETLITLRKNGQNENDMYFMVVKSAIKNKKGITLQQYNNILWLFDTVQNW